MKILFMTDYWFPKKTANAVCAENIARALIADGNKVFVSTYAVKGINLQNKDGIEFSYTKPVLARRLLSRAQTAQNKSVSKLYGILGKSLNRLRRLILLPWYPVVSFSASKRWAKIVTDTVSREGIDVVVTVNAPEEATYTGYLIKKKLPNVKWVIYNIDSGSNVLPGTTFEKLKKRLQQKAIAWENKMVSAADRIIVMEGHSNYFNHNLSPENRKKLFVANVPLLNMTGLTSAAPHTPNQGIQKWVYTGKLGSAIYDPKALCDLFLEYSKFHACELHLYGSANQCEYIMNREDQNIIWHGMVSHDEIEKVQSEADLLVFFVCKDLDSVSGKMFEYLLRGKPIVYLGPKDDINARNLAKYSEGLSLDICDTPEQNAARLHGFMQQRAGKASTVSLLSIKEQFRNSLPETTAKMLVDW